MPVPETTSAEAFERYVGGKCLRAGRGEPWRDIKAWIIAPPRAVELLHLPSVSEPFLAWSISGEVDFQERENQRPWTTYRNKKGSFSLTFVPFVAFCELCSFEQYLNKSSKMGCDGAANSQ